MVGIKEHLENNSLNVRRMTPCRILLERIRHSWNSKFWQYQDDVMLSVNCMRIFLTDQTEHADLHWQWQAQKQSKTYAVCNKVQSTASQNA